ncbi:MAG: LacI family DNA-binding transcriptional regulator [Pseudomonadota bacterium]
MANIKDVARKSGVSIATVSRVVNSSEHRVSAETRERVLQAIKELDYRPNALAQGLIMKRSMTVGIIIPDISNPYYAEIVRGIQDVADRTGYAVMLQNTDRKKERIIKCIQLLREKRADGIIFSGGILHGFETLSTLRELSQRVVVIGRHEVDFPAVRVDNILGAAQAVQHLIDLGHRKIGFISGSRMSTTSVDRLRGYRNSLAQFGVPYESARVRQGNLTPESGYLAAKTLLDQKERVTAIFAANDLMAYGVINAAKEQGLRVPEDLSVIGFDNIPLSGYFDPPLTTVEIPMYDLGVAAMEMLADLISTIDLNRLKIVQTSLILRGSTKKSSKKDLT